MKILIVGPGLMEIPPKGWGAVEILVWDQYLALKKLGHSVFILNTRSCDKWILSRLKHGYHISKKRKEDKNWAYPVTEELINSWVSERICHYNS